MPLMTIASSQDPQPAYERLLAAGVHCRPEGWVVSSSTEIEVALSSPQLRVKPPPVPPGHAAELVSRMARFSDGDDHVRRRALVAGLLPPPDILRPAAEARTTALLERAGAVVDVVPVAREVPVAVLVEALGVAEVGTLVGELCDALAPSLLPELRCGDGAARRLVEVLGQDEEGVAAVVGLLFQARDATAALVAAAMLLDPAQPPAVRVERVLREQAPVQCTLRVAAQHTALGDAVVPTGAVLWVLLGAAEAEPPMAFGRGPHSCPGADHAVAIASGMVSAFDHGRWHRVPTDEVVWEPRPNLRMPTQVLMERT